MSWPVTDSHIIKTLRTIRYLKPAQVLYRLKREARVEVFGRCGRKKTPVSPGKVLWRPLHVTTPFLKRRQFAKADIDRRRFIFLNEIAEFEAGIDWSAPGVGRLWRYNLNYFDYLAPSEGLPSGPGVAIMRDWIEQNPPGTPDTWDPYPTSLRSVNWMKYLSENAIASDEAERIAGSLYEQVLWLEKDLEYHLLANHLFKNAKALAFAGLFFTGPDAGRWLDKGLSILSQQLPEQILHDGGHFERSPMYHSMVLEDCLDLLNICLQYDEERLKRVSEILEETTGRMARFLRGIVHPDGRIALFNDSAFGIEAEPGDLVDYYGRITGSVPEERSGLAWSFPETGYYVMSPGEGGRLIIDCGNIGPDYQPGHSHCDTLSFELSLRGKRIVVDSGCFGYEDGTVRRYNRGNAGHNTLTLDAENQSEVWASHRCARRAYPLYAKLSERKNGEIVFEGAHDGYQRLPGKPVHRRSFSWVDREILIADTVEGSGRHSVEIGLHINPELLAERRGDTVAIMDEGAMIAEISLWDGGPVEEYKGWYCPEFGKKIPCTVLGAKYAERDLPFRCAWRIKISA